MFVSKHTWKIGEKIIGAILALSFVFPTIIIPDRTEAATISKTLRRPNNDLGLVAYWTLDGIHTSTSTSGVLDISGNGKHGTLFGLGGGTTTVENINAAGSYLWRAPKGIPGVTSVQVELYGGGGSGGGAGGGTNQEGGGGAGGQYARKQVAVNPGTGYSLVVAATRAGVSNGNGIAGNDSTFNSTTVVAKGGAPGLSHGNGGTGGTGSTASGVGDVVNAGGNGSNGGGSCTGAGGAGGGGAGSGGAGGNASGQTAGTGTSNNPGGNGGASGTSSTGANGVAASTTGGGGGGGGGCNGSSTSNRIGGTGAKGYARLTYLSPRTVPAPIAGRVSQGLQFAGTSTSNAIMGNVYNGVQSVSFWMKQASSTMTHGIIELNSSTRISWASGAITTTGITSPTVYIDGVQTSALNDFNWHHVTVTTGTPINADSVKFGSTTVATFFEGALDDVRLYSRVLSASDVSGVYHVGATSKTSVSLVGSDRLKNGLVGWWTLDGPDMLTNVRDRSGLGNHGNLSGFTSTTTVAGKLGQALQFNGTTNAVNLGSPASFDLSTTMSVCAWVSANSFPVGGGLIVGQSDAGGTNFPFALIASDDNLGSIEFLWVTGGTAEEYIANSTTLSLHRWYHVCAVRTSLSNVDIYINGSEVGLTSGGNEIPPTQQPTYVGGITAFGGGGWDGSLDDVRIYNRVLSASEVVELYNIGASSAKIGKSSAGGTDLMNGLVGWWTFDGTKMLSNVADSSGQGNNGNLQGFTSTTTGPGKLGQALEFDGSNDYVLVNGFTAPSEGTFTAWLTTDYNEATCCSSFPMVFVSSDPRTSVWYNGTSDYFALSTNSSLTNRATYSPGGDVIGWFHLAVTWSASGSQFYRDGEPVGTPGTGDNSGASGSTFYLGTRSTLDRWHDGMMDDVRVYNRVLSGDEIRRIYQLGR